MMVVVKFLTVADRQLTRFFHSRSRCFSSRSTASESKWAVDSPTGWSVVIPENIPLTYLQRFRNSECYKLRRTANLKKIYEKLQIPTNIIFGAFYLRSTSSGKFVIECGDAIFGQVFIEISILWRTRLIIISIHLVTSVQTLGILQYKK